MSAPAAATAAPLPSPEELRRGLSRLKAVPTLPRLLQRIIVAVDDPAVHLDHVAELIEVDQALVAQILRLANSAFYGSQGRVSRVKQALLLLGTVVTRCLVLATAVFDVRHVRLQGFWEHALGTAVASGALATVTGRGKPEEVTTAGLLHDLGKVMLCKELPEVFELAVARARAEHRSLLLVEREILGVDHAEIGGWLAEQWRFPAVLADPIRYHHAPARSHHAVDETALVHVANALVGGLGYGSGGDPCVPAIDAAAWRRLGLGPSRLDAALERFERDLDHALNYALFE